MCSEGSLGLMRLGLSLESDPINDSLEYSKVSNEKNESWTRASTAKINVQCHDCSSLIALSMF